MADTRTSFTVLEDSSTQAGLPIHKVLQGDALAAKNAIPALIAKDISGNLRYPLVDALDQLVVTTDSSALANLSATGTVAGNAAFTPVATITLVANRVYRDISVMAACFRDAEFKLVFTDDVTPTDLALGILTGAGALSVAASLKSLEFTAGATGTQTLTLEAKNLNALSDFRGTIAVQEVQP
jgi:hypothetical protein